MGDEASDMWMIRYFHVPSGRWRGGRLYGNADAAVADFIKLAESPRVGAVRLYDPSQRYADVDDYLWGDDKLPHWGDDKLRQDVRREADVAATLETR